MASTGLITVPSVDAQSGMNLLEADAARETLFNKIRDQLAASSLFSNSTRAPNIFIVYAHDNVNEGTAHDECVRKIIKWLGDIHARILSDQAPLPPLKRRLEGDDAIRNILANQLCLLPPKPDSTGMPTTTSVDNVIVCGSEVLEKYYTKPAALSYIQDIVHICHNGVDQSAAALQSTILDRVETESGKDGFHHILTEIAFLEARKSISPQAHGMVPVALSQRNVDEAPMRYLPIFHNTDVKLKLKSPETSFLHKLFFKLMEQLFPDDRDFIGPFKDCYNSVTSTLKLDDGARVTRGRFDEIVNPGLTRAYQRFWALFCVVVRDGKLQAYTGELSDQVSQVLKMTDLATRHSILQWLSPMSASELHGRFHDSGTNRLQGTCDWVIQDEDFQQWYANKGSALIFLCGNMGTGKTYSTSRLVDWVQDGLSTNNNDEALAYFYCNKQDPMRREPKEILRNIIRQMAIGPWREGEKSKTIHNKVHDLWESSRGQGISSTFAQWEACLVALIDTYPRTTIVLDAFDECEKEQRQELMQLFVTLAARHSEASPVKIFISTRPEEDVLKQFDTYPAIRMKDAHNAEDIVTFVRTKIAKHRRWSKMSEDFKTEVIDTLVKKSGNMFLFASLQIQHLLLCRTEPALKDRLGKLPDSLEETYEEIYQTATSQSDERKLLDRAIKWVLCSAKPLNTNMLLLAISQDFESDGVVEQRQDVDEELILGLSQNLLCLEGGMDDYLDDDDFDDWDLNDWNGSPVWRVAHQAVAEFFESSAYCNSDLAHYEVGNVCLMVLLKTFDGEPALSPNSPEDDFSGSSERFMCPCRCGEDVHDEVENPLVEYAIWAWPTHVRAQEQREARSIAGLSQKLQEFLGEPDEGSPIYKRWMNHAFAPYPAPRWSIFARRKLPRLRHGKHIMKPISLACYLGFYTPLAEWWDQCRFDDKVCYYATAWDPWEPSGLGPFDKVDEPLRWSFVTLACAHDEHEILKRLLDRGAHLSTIEEFEVPPILAAAGGDSVKCAKELLQRGSEIYSPFTRRHFDVLQCAIRRDSLRVMKLLLSQVVAGPLEVEKMLNRCECQGWISRSEDAVILLVDTGLNVNTRLRDGSLLAAAAGLRWDYLIRRLLDKGADVNTQFEGQRFRNALEAALSVCPTLSILQLLIEYGARVTSRAISSVPEMAVQQQRDQILQLLFKQSPDLDEIWTDQNGNNTSALIEVVRDGKTDDACRLIQHGADVNLKVGGKRGDALSTVLECDWNGYPTVEMTKVLVDAVASRENTEDDCLNTALAAAAYAVLEDMVQCFLDRGASPNAVCAHKWTTALGAAAASKDPRASNIIQVLLDRGAGVNTYSPAAVGNLLLMNRLALDGPFFLLAEFAIYESSRERMHNWLQSAWVLLSNGAIWDVDFTQWRECLERRASGFCRQNSQSLDQMLQTLKNNRTSFFLANPGAASDERWRIKGAEDPSSETRSVLTKIKECQAGLYV